MNSLSGRCQIGFRWDAVFDLIFNHFCWFCLCVQVDPLKTGSHERNNCQALCTKCCQVHGLHVWNSDDNLPPYKTSAHQALAGDASSTKDNTQGHDYAPSSSENLEGNIPKNIWKFEGISWPRGVFTKILLSRRWRWQGDPPPKKHTL